MKAIRKLYHIWQAYHTATNVDVRLEEPAKLQDPSTSCKFPSGNRTWTSAGCSPGTRACLPTDIYLAWTYPRPSSVAAQAFPCSLPLPPPIMAASNVNPRLTPHSQRLTPINRIITGELGFSAADPKGRGAFPDLLKGGERRRSPSLRCCRRETRCMKLICR